MNLNNDLIKEFSHCDYLKKLIIEFKNEKLINREKNINFINII